MAIKNDARSPTIPKSIIGLSGQHQYLQSLTA